MFGCLRDRVGMCWSAAGSTPGEAPQASHDKRFRVCGSIDSAMPEELLTVAVLPPFPLVFRIDGPVPRQDDPWELLPKVRVVGDQDETLRAILRRACHAAGVRLDDEFIEAADRIRRDERREPTEHDVADQLVYVLLRLPDDDVVEQDTTDYSILRRGTRPRSIGVVVRDACARAVWRRPGLDATLSELLDASTAGLIDGDPLQPYLIPSIPQGDVGGLDRWITFTHALEAFWSVLTAAGAIEGALALRDRLRELRRRRAMTAKTVSVHAADWKTRGAAPSDLLKLLAARERPTQEVAALLGCSDPEAEALLWGLGFAHDDEHGTWRHRSDAAAALIADDVDLAFMDSVAVLDDFAGLTEVTTERLQSFLDNGQAPDIEEARERLSRRLSP